MPESSRFFGIVIRMSVRLAPATIFLTYTRTIRTALVSTASTR